MAGVVVLVIVVLAVVEPVVVRTPAGKVLRRSLRTDGRTRPGARRRRQRASRPAEYGKQG
jgi:hypothetical protein